jgi:hypothetical protein
MTVEAEAYQAKGICRFCSQFDSVNLIWPTLITYLATPWVNQLPHPGRSEALRRP